MPSTETAGRVKQLHSDTSLSGTAASRSEGSASTSEQQETGRCSGQLSLSNSAAQPSPFQLLQDEDALHHADVHVVVITRPSSKDGGMATSNVERPPPAGVSPPLPSCKHLVIPPLDLSVIKPNKGHDKLPPGPAQLQALQQKQTNDEDSEGGWQEEDDDDDEESEDDDDLGSECSTMRPLAHDAPINDNKGYIYKPVQPQEINRVRALLSRLGPSDAEEVQGLWSALLTARHDTESAMARGVRVARDISRDWQDTVSDLIDRVVAQDAQISELKQQLKTLPDMGSCMDEMQSTISRLRRQRERLTRENADLQQAAQEKDAAMAELQAENAKLQDNLARLQAQMTDMRSRTRVMYDQHQVMLKHSLEHSIRGHDAEMRQQDGPLSPRRHQGSSSSKATWSTGSRDKEGLSPRMAALHSRGHAPLALARANSNDSLDSSYDQEPTPAGPAAGQHRHRGDGLMSQEEAALHRQLDMMSSYKI